MLEDPLRNVLALGVASRGRGRQVVGYLLGDRSLRARTANGDTHHRANRGKEHYRGAKRAPRREPAQVLDARKSLRERR